MSDKYVFVIYLMVYIVTIIYFVALGCYMLAQRGTPLSTRGELAAKLRMTRTMGVTMFVWAFEMLLYLPTMLLDFSPDAPLYKLYFLIMLLLITPMTFALMFAVVQRKVNMQRWMCAICAPFGALIVWYFVAPPQGTEIPVYVYIAAAFSLASYLFLLIRFSSEYHHYMRRLQMEYSDVSGREIFWSWICFAGMAIQCIVYVVYELFWSPLGEALYLLLSIHNATCFCICICKQRTIDLDVVPEVEPEETIDDKAEEGTFYADIEQKLKTLCEDKYLFLDPELKRETLSLRLAINRTYLYMYFRHCGTSYYQYINTLRIEYAVKLMQENPDLTLDEVCERSGYRTQNTFRKAFQEVMGCLPSEVKNKK